MCSRNLRTAHVILSRLFPNFLCFEGIPRALNQNSFDTSLLDQQLAKTSDQSITRERTYL
jgi:hypothetical protein